jgi:riboflavin biosynthesis pyrimidine reductase
MLKPPACSREGNSMNRPKVVVYGGVSLDGRLTIAPGLLLMFGDKRWNAIAESDEEISKWLKDTHKPQAYLEGSGSLVTEKEKPKPLPTFKGDPKTLYRDFLPDSVVKRVGHSGWFAMVDSRGRIRWGFKEWPSEEWKGWHLMVIVANQTPSEYLAYLQRETIPYLLAGEDRVNLKLALEKMKSLLGVTSIVSTSPGKLGGALLRAGLIDEVNLLLLPALIGGTETPTLFESSELKPNEWPTRLELVWTRVQSDGRVWLRYKVAAKRKNRANKH